MEIASLTKFCCSSAHTALGAPAEGFEGWAWIFARFCGGSPDFLQLWSRNSLSWSHTQSSHWSWCPSWRVGGLGTDFCLHFLQLWIPSLTPEQSCSCYCLFPHTLSLQHSHGTNTWLRGCQLGGKAAQDVFGPYSGESTKLMWPRAA